MAASKGLQGVVDRRNWQCRYWCNCMHRLQGRNRPHTQCWQLHSLPSWHVCFKCWEIVLWALCSGQVRWREQRWGPANTSWQWQNSGRNLFKSSALKGARRGVTWLRFFRNKVRLKSNKLLWRPSNPGCVRRIDRSQHEKTQLAWSAMIDLWNCQVWPGSCFEDRLGTIPPLSEERCDGKKRPLPLDSTAYLQFAVCQSMRPIFWRIQRFWEKCGEKVVWESLEIARFMRSIAKSSALRSGGSRTDCNLARLGAVYQQRNVTEQNLPLVAP